MVTLDTGTCSTGTDLTGYWYVGNRNARPRLSLRAGAGMEKKPFNIPHNNVPVAVPFNFYYNKFYLPGTDLVLR
jgi:hypothetical protein